ncbi:methyl-accepting chemotaxis protein [Halopseudomonas phragmitis]|uniref:Chemotaxis protein n=3 Tax=Pseudomonadaceae TaxID=135621 RepID=A0A1V0B516_9GAMM|nr:MULTISPECIES: methyl-accepting chemotaxis protein [Pseudomonadaceae]AQZ95036.1 chemotaxis protein [Halopseudomonas phragmitis]RHW21830.1 methyl-accepting chemotaxis protein [Pseudomonas jilinensis]
MSWLRSLNISARLWLILGASVLMLFALGSLMLQQLNNQLYAGKAEKTQHVVESTLGILQHFHQRQQSGELDREQAQQQAMALIRQLRYDGQEYYWINDLHPRMVMHPTNPALEGEDLSGYRDPDGKALFNEMVAVARGPGAGVVDYRWPKPGSAQPVEKVSYVQLFEPWGWILGSGVYIDDIRALFWQQVLRAALLAGVIALLLGLLIMFIAQSISRPLRASVAAMADIATGEGDLTRRLDEQGADELTALARHFNAFTGKLAGVVRQLLSSAGALDQSALRLGDVAGSTQDKSGKQSQQMEMIATAVNEVSYAVQDVAKNAEHAAAEVRQADDYARAGQASIEQSLTQVDQLAVTMSRAVVTMESLAQDSNQIGRVLEVIEAIAEQTNLLALNAAIEAARAGEQGRGFAVVADEVRLLAQRTQKSTAEIQQMISTLQSNAQAAVKVIHDGSEATQVTVQRTTEAGSQLAQIVTALQTVNGLNESIASATLQQSHVVDDINRNVTEVAGLARDNAESADESSRASQQLTALARELNQVLGQFRV